MYSVRSGSVLKVNDGNDLIRLYSEQEQQLNICPVSPNRHPWKGGSRSEYEAKDDRSEGHETLVKTVNSLKQTIQTPGKHLTPSAERGGWPLEDLWAE